MGWIQASTRNSSPEDSAIWTHGRTNGSAAQHSLEVRNSWPGVWRCPGMGLLLEQPLKPLEVLSSKWVPNTKQVLLLRWAACIAQSFTCWPQRGGLKPQQQSSVLLPNYHPLPLRHLLAVKFTGPSIANGWYLFPFLQCFSLKNSDNSMYLILGKWKIALIFSSFFVFYFSLSLFYWALNINNQPSLTQLILQILIFFMPSTIKPKKGLMKAEEMVRVIKNQFFFCIW